MNQELFWSITSVVSVLVFLERVLDRLDLVRRRQTAIERLPADPARPTVERLRCPATALVWDSGRGAPLVPGYGYLSGLDADQLKQHKRQGRVYCLQEVTCANDEVKQYIVERDAPTVPPYAAGEPISTPAACGETVDAEAPADLKLAATEVEAEIIVAEYQFELGRKDAIQSRAATVLTVSLGVGGLALTYTASVASQANVPQGLGWVILVLLAITVAALGTAVVLSVVTLMVRGYPVVSATNSECLGDRLLHAMLHESNTLSSTDSQLLKARCRSAIYYGALRGFVRTNDSRFRWLDYALWAVLLATASVLLAAGAAAVYSLGKNLEVFI